MLCNTLIICTLSHGSYRDRAKARNITDNQLVTILIIREMKYLPKYCDEQFVGCVGFWEKQFEMKASFQELISGDKPVLVDFFATWCQPCKMQAPILEQLSAEMQDRIRIIKIDVDRNQNIAQQYQVQGVPTLAVFKKGQLLWRNSGVHNKQQLLQVLTPFL